MFIPGRGLSLDTEELVVEDLLDLHNNSLSAISSLVSSITISKALQARAVQDFALLAHDTWSLTTPSESGLADQAI